MVVRVDRVTIGGHSATLLLVVFDDAADARGRALALAQNSNPFKEILQLQAEVERLQARLSAARNDRGRHERADELLTVVDELESAREELQAVNEELVTLSDENQRRFEALSQLSNDLQHLLESTGLATLLVDRSLNIVRYTPLVAELFHLTGSDVGRSLEDLNHRLRYPQLIADVWRVLRDETTVDLEVETQDERWFLVRVLPYRSALHGLEGAVVVLIDVTARKQAELAVRQSDRRKDEFLAVLAHELRNPLAPIGAGIEILRRAPDDPAMVRRVTVTMARQTQQLVRLVDDLLEVARISAGKLTLRIEPLVIGDVVRDAVAAVQPFIDSLEHVLTISVPDESVVVDGDAARLTQVVANLLHNAARYTPRGGRIRLLVHIECESAVISVRDNGSGISAEALPNVFELFYQGGNSADPAKPGLGIGLTLAKKVVELHGGTISAESAALNQGSTFTVRLPLSHSALRQTGNGDASPSIGKQRVLIVDDNADAAETLQMLMRTLVSGEVEIASSGDEALRLGARLHPNVVLLDLGMPNMDGYEVARRMRGESWGKSALLIAITGWGQEEHRRRSREAGFDRHMTKPADPDALRAVLNGADEAVTQ
jgi:PAS domain S-box-containing protein